METRIETSSLNEFGITPEEAQEISKRLREKRETLKRSLEDISKELKIAVVRLECMENGNWEELPGGGLGRGLIRLYANKLGVTLPEFEKFSDTQASTMPPQSLLNLDRMVGFARAKKFNQMDYQKRDLNFTFFRNLFKKANKEGSVQKNHIKKWLMISGSAIFIIGVGITSLTMLSEKNTNDFAEIEQVDQTDPPLVDAQFNDENQDVQLSENDPQNAPASNIEESVSANLATATPAEPILPPSSVAIADPSLQKMQIDILSPVAIRVEADGKEVLGGMTNSGTMHFEFKKNIILVIQDSSKVKLSYAGWQQEPLSFGARKRIIVLNAKRFADEN